MNPTNRVEFVILIKKEEAKTSLSEETLFFRKHSILLYVI